METDSSPSIIAAIAAGRGKRNPSAAEAWVLHRARVLTAIQSGFTLGRIGGNLGLSASHLQTLVAEACDAVLRGGLASEEAEAVCLGRWRSWCNRGDTAVCDRLRKM